MPLTASVAREPSDGMGQHAQAEEAQVALGEDGGRICRVVVTIRVPMQLVSRCFLMMRPPDAPSAGSGDILALTSASGPGSGTIRAMPTQYSSAKMMKMDTIKAEGLHPAKPAGRQRFQRFL